MEKYKKSIKNNKFKISAPKQNEKFELLDGLYSVSDIQDCLKYMIKKHETLIDNHPLRIYVNKIGKRITFEIKTRYYLQLLTSEAMKLLRTTKTTKHENGKNVPHLEIFEVVLVHCNIFNSNYQTQLNLVNYQKFYLKT